MSEGGWESLEEVAPLVVLCLKQRWDSVCVLPAGHAEGLHHWGKPR